MYGAVVFLPAAAAISAFACLPLWIVQKRRQTAVPAARKLVHFAFMGMLVMLVFATLLWGGIRFPVEYHFLNLRPFSFLSSPYEMGVRRMIKQLILNVMMFVPMGFLLPAVFFRLQSFWKTGFVSLLCTASIETIQYFIGRSSDIDDVLMNLLGGLLGYGLFLLADRLFRKKPFWQKALSLPDSETPAS